MNIQEWINENWVAFTVILLLTFLIIALLFVLIVFQIKFKKETKKSKSANNNESDNLSSLNNEIQANSAKQINNLYLKLQKEIENTKINNKRLENVKEQYLNAIDRLDQMRNQETERLSRIANLSVEDAKKILIQNLYKNMRPELNRIYEAERKRFQEEYEIQAQNLLVNAMEGMAEKMVSQRSLSIIPIEDESLKGRIIGKNGRNKHIFESLTGVDIIVDKKAEISISSVNPIRRQIAVNLFEAMLQTKVIEPSKLENLYKNVVDEFNAKLMKYGQAAIEDELKIYDLNPEIYPYVGRLQFRTSYGQNALRHCIEAARYAEILAHQLGIDPEKAKRAAFFHDIGKSVDFDENYDHVESGLIIARKFNLPEYIYNAIESHHNKVEPNNIYAALVKVVDTLSAARPGARVDAFNEFLKRVTRLENICMQIEGVKEAYAIQSGRTLRVIVKPDIIRDDELGLLKYEIQKVIESDPLTNKHQIKVIMIRENRLEFMANQKVTTSLLS